MTGTTKQLETRLQSHTLLHFNSVNSDLKLTLLILSLRINQSALSYLVCNLTMSLRSSLTFSMHHLSLRGGGDVPFFRARMFSTANCSALIFLAVPLAELFFVFFCFFFFHQHNRKGKSIFFFSFDKAVYLIALPHQNLNAPPLCGKKNS